MTEPVPAGARWEDLAPSLHEAIAPEGTHALVVETSGSSGTPKRVRLSGPALHASGLATAQVLGGHGRWVLALPTHHVAGLQVLARSALAGTSPVALPPEQPFTPDAFADAVRRLGPRPDRPDAPLNLTSLVPTQLLRLVTDPTGREALGHLDAVLLGGAAADPALVEHGRATGAAVLTTYGMSETCGGCVYDGVPLPGVQVRLGPDDRIHLAGPVLADGYPDDPRLTAQRFVQAEGRRWFVTDDRGVWSEGRLRILGRVDDVVVTGGHKVEPRDVETALRALPQVHDAAVVGVPDPEWGEVVGALVVPAADRAPQAGGGPDPLPEGGPDLLAHLREALRAASPPHTLPPHALPRRAASASTIPLLASGKPDREAVRRML